jgi:phenolic acid decarboxylase
MERQHTENLFRRYKGQLVNIKTISAGVYKGHVGEITNDYVALTDRDSKDGMQTFIFFEAIESVVVAEVPERTA